jgi:hypothetical protein
MIHVLRGDAKRWYWVEEPAPLRMWYSGQVIMIEDLIQFEHNLNLTVIQAGGGW